MCQTSSVTMISHPGGRLSGSDARVPAIRAASVTRLIVAPSGNSTSAAVDARLLRELLAEGRLPESWIPPEHMLEIRTLGRLYCALMDERRAWQQRIHAQLYHQGVPPVRREISGISTSGYGLRVFIAFPFR
jgi:hypothetical protein